MTKAGLGADHDDVAGDRDGDLDVAGRQRQAGRKIRRPDAARDLGQVAGIDDGDGRAVVGLFADGDALLAAAERDEGLERREEPVGRGLVGRGDDQPAFGSPVSVVDHDGGVADPAEGRIRSPDEAERLVELVEHRLEGGIGTVEVERLLEGLAVVVGDRRDDGRRRDVLDEGRGPVLGRAGGRLRPRSGQLRDDRIVLERQPVGRPVRDELEHRVADGRGDSAATDLRHRLRRLEGPVEQRTEGHVHEPDVVAAG